jgi:hypothetical protein
MAISAWLALAQCVAATYYVAPAQRAALAKSVAPAWLAYSVVT